jgi:Ca-activated chloride channel homolog
VIILLTDGVNTGGSIPPQTAAEIAKTFGIRVYTVGVGTIGMAPYPAKNMFGQTVYQDMEVKIDEDMMRKISAMTDGKYFRATDNAKLEKVYEEIDALEKSKIDVTEFRKKKEEFLPFALAALILLGFEVLLRTTLLRVFP